MKLFLYKNWIFLSLLVTCIPVYGQPPPRPEYQSQPMETPIDKNIFAFLVICILFGLYKLNQYKRNRT